MGKEERLALKCKPKVEDGVIGTFVVLALLYPFLITFFIYVQEERESSEELNILRMAYVFVVGMEDCSPQIASQVAQFMDRRLLERLGGVGGLVRTCNRNRERIKGSVNIDERVSRKDDRVTIYVKIRIRERGVVKDVVSLKVTGVRRGEVFRIMEMEYAEGG